MLQGILSQASQTIFIADSIGSKATVERGL